MFNLLSAVNYIHSAEVMHRDIKPANLLIDSDCNIKICDFGMSRVHESNVVDIDTGTLVAKMMEIKEEEAKV
jgi:serine/threonine protein kinase